MFSICTRGSPLCRVWSAWSAIVSVMSADLSCARQVLDVQVDHDRQQQHDPEERLEPVGIPAGVHDAEAGHAEDESADGDTDAVAVATGEQGSAYHRGDDVEELVTHAVAGLQHIEVVEVVHSGEPGEEGHRHEQADLDTYDRDTHGASRGSIAADGEDPVADTRSLEYVRREQGEQQPPDHGDLQGHRADLELVREDPVE